MSIREHGTGEVIFSNRTACARVLARAAKTARVWERAGSGDRALRRWNRLREAVGRVHEVGAATASKRISRTDARTNSPVREKGRSTMLDFSSVWVMAGLLVLVILVILVTFAKMLRKAGPHEALVIYGIRGPRTITNGGTIILPMLEQCRELSLELMSFDVAPQQSLYTNQGVAVTVEAVAQLKVKSDPVSIRTAAEQFLTKRPEQREGLDSAGDGRPSPRNHRPAHGRTNREGTGNGRRSHAFHMRGRHEQDGARRRELHD